jgi:hypothetical protein
MTSMSSHFSFTGKPTTRRHRGAQPDRHPALELLAGSDAAPRRFETRREIERYFGGETIECLLCGRKFKRLQTHLATKHEMTADDYKTRFGLPWTRGLTSAASLANSGWTDERKARARKLARQSRFFELARLAPRREAAPFLRAEAIEHLGVNAKALGEKFDLRVRALAEKGLSSRAIARVLKVAIVPFSIASSDGARAIPNGERYSLALDRQASERSNVRSLLPKGRDNHSSESRCALCTKRTDSAISSYSAAIFCNSSRARTSAI